jgi:UDP-GlcNAc3NAcA epimerase
MPKIMTVVGARPQFIKAAVVSRLIRSGRDFTEILVHTGQHYDDNMSSVFFDELAIPKPDHFLGIGSGSHGDQTGRMLASLERVCLEAKPDWMLVYGDTNSTLAGALAAAKLQVPVAHVEAGLRSYNRGMPEEINRVVTDHLSTVLFAPTAASIANLEREGIDSKKISVVGDVMYDAVTFYSGRAESSSRILAEHALDKGQYVLATIHRAENTDDPKTLSSIVRGLNAVAESIAVVFPMHPRTRNSLQRAGASGDLSRNVKVIPPVGYLDMIKLERNAALIATDSGGVQKEAFFQRVPCVTLRGETEWVELVDLGWNFLVCAQDSGAIAQAVKQRLGTRGKDAAPYGEGDAGARILARLRNLP